MKPDFWNSVSTTLSRLRLPVFFAAMVLFGGNPLNAQTGLPANVVLPEGVVVVPPPGVIPSSVLASTNKTTGKKSPESASPEDKRLQELLKLQFDRRPQSIFKTLAKQAEESTTSTNEVSRFEADVITGNWKAVKAFIAGLPEKQAPQVYKHLLQQLQKTPSGGQPDSPEQMQMMMNQSQSPGIRPAGPVLLPDDVLALSEMAPGELTEEQVELLGKLLSSSLSKVTFIDPFLKKLEAGTEQLGGQDEKKRNLAAKLLIAAGRLTDVGKFLPPLDPAIEKKEIKTIDLHARHLHALAKQPKETNSTYLKKSWELTQMVLSATNSPTEERQLALKRSLELMPLLSKELGTNWLRSNFEQRPEQGMAVLATIGSIASQGVSTREAEPRRKNMELQYRVADALLAVVGENADTWKPALNVLAMNWLQEADYAKQRYVKPRPQNMPQFDMYGNQIYFGNEYYPGNYQDQNQPPCVPPDQLLPTAPSGAWLAMLDKSLARRITLVTAELYLKLEEEQKALPHLEALVADEPKAALNLANDLLRTWARSHDPNNQQQNMQRYYNPYVQMQPQGISLTRAMQVRNLHELSQLLQRLRALSIGRLDDRAVVAAFSASHSQAEVFRVEDIETVFGPIADMTPETLSELLQTMRQRLATQWRQPRVQQDAKTKRTDKEIEAEVMRGYDLLTQLIDQGVTRQPNDWRMNLVQGAAVFDSAEFDYGRKVDLAIYTAKRDKAFKAFEKAAALYAEKLPSLEEKEQTSQAYLQWFNATLGASDLAYITRQTEPNTNNLIKIRQAILSLPGDASVRHIASFGKSISDSLNTLKGELKPRYLRAALQIVGDHESAAEARKLVTYYDDLLQEISLDVRIDGDATVGHGKPFGIFVALRHSEAVGRESGGFSKYLQNQQNQQYYYNPYGTQPVNYRENFEKQVREKFAQGFEVVSVIFHEDKVQPRGYGRPGWRETPYAYILIKAKDGAVDRIPPLQLDLDFFDKRGQVVLPVTSQVQLIDARPDSVPARPATKLSVLQILDDRDLNKGKITLEIKATANGLLPELKELFDVDIASFKIDKIDDQGLAINKLDAEGELVAPISERNWLIHLMLEKSESAAANFNFPKAKLDGMELTYKRYSDADLVEVKPALALSGIPLKSSGYMKWILASAALLIGGFAWLKLGSKGAPVLAEKNAVYTIPGHITPFTVLNLLRRMHADATLSLTPEQRRELSETIQKLQRHYFDRTKESSTDFNLEQLVKQWVSFAR